MHVFADHSRGADRRAGFPARRRARGADRRHAGADAAGRAAWPPIRNASRAARRASRSSTRWSPTRRSWSTAIWQTPRRRICRSPTSTSSSRWPRSSRRRPAWRRAVSRRRPSSSTGSRRACACSPTRPFSTGFSAAKGRPADRPIYQSDIEKPTPYNTYVIDGLPPTPIANPGRAALEAVANPSQTDDLYFVADGTGGHVFASTLRRAQRERRALAGDPEEAGREAAKADGNRTTPARRDHTEAERRRRSPSAAWTAALEREERDMSLAKHDRLCARRCATRRRAIAWEVKSVNGKSDRGAAAPAAGLRAARAAGAAGGAEALFARQFPGDADPGRARRRAGAAGGQRGIPEGLAGAGQAAGRQQFGVAPASADGLLALRGVLDVPETVETRRAARRRSMPPSLTFSTTALDGLERRASSGGRRRCNAAPCDPPRCDRGADAAGRGRSVARAGSDPLSASPNRCGLLLDASNSLDEQRLLSWRPRSWRPRPISARRSTG